MLTNINRNKRPKIYCKYINFISFQTYPRETLYFCTLDLLLYFVLSISHILTFHVVLSRCQYQCLHTQYAPSTPNESHPKPHQQHSKPSNKLCSSTHFFVLFLVYLFKSIILMCTSDGAQIYCKHPSPKLHQTQNHPETTQCPITKCP